MTEADVTNDLAAAARFVKWQALAVVIVGAILAVISLISGSWIVSLLFFGMWLAMAWLLYWSAKSLQRRSRRGGSIILVLTGLMTINAVALIVTIPVAVLGWLASIRVVRHWTSLR